MGHPSQPERPTTAEGTRLRARGRLAYETYSKWMALSFPEECSADFSDFNTLHCDERNVWYRVVLALHAASQSEGDTRESKG